MDTYPSPVSPAMAETPAPAKTLSQVGEARKYMAEAMQFMAQAKEQERLDLIQARAKNAIERLVEKRPAGTRIPENKLELINVLDELVKDSRKNGVMLMGYERKAIKECHTRVRQALGIELLRDLLESFGA